MQRYDIEAHDENVAAFAAYAARTHRSRWWGVVAALFASGAGALGSVGDSSGQRIAWVFVGYLLGSAAAEVLSPQRYASGTIHTASLTSRLPSLLLPAWARILPWLALLPCLATPLLLMGDHQTGVIRVHDASGSAMVRASWFSTSALITIAVTAAAALAFWWLTLRYLARRRLPVDSVDAARLDMLTRALSARAVSGAATALGLSLLAGLAFLSSQPLVSMTCTTPRDCHYLYAWNDSYDFIQNVGWLLLAAAIIFFWLGRLQRVNPSLLRSAVGIAQ